MSSVTRLRRAELGPLDYLAKGGQARVHLAPQLEVAGERGPFVFKEYKSKTVSIRGLDGVVAFRLRLQEYERRVLDVLTNWPLRVVEMDGGASDGVILQLIPDEFFHEIRLPSGTVKRRPRDGEYLPQPAERCARVDVPLAGLGDRYRFCRDLAFAIGFLHRRDVCIGDISFGNVAFALHLDPSAYLMDCDAFRLKGHAPVVPQLHTPDWIPPEGSGVQTVGTDLYKLGLFILRALVPAQLSAQNRDPRWADSALDSRGRQLLRRALGPDVQDRTTAKDWFRHFDESLRRRDFRLPARRSRMPRRPLPAAP